MAKKLTKPSAQPHSNGTSGNGADPSANPEEEKSSSATTKSQAAVPAAGGKPSSTQPKPKTDDLPVEPTAGTPATITNPNTVKATSKTSKAIANDTTAPVKTAPKEKTSAKTSSGAKTAKTKTANLPATPPPALPKVTKPINIDNAQEIIIKQAYNPKKLPPFIKKQQQRLLELRNALLDSLDGVTKEALRSRPEGGDSGVGGMHMGDAGSDAYDRDFALSMLTKEQDALYEINEALKRLDNGVYGICELSGQKINEERLEAIPYTRYTRDMQEQIERDQIGGRFRRPVVRSVFGLDDAADEDDEDADDEGSNNSSSNNDSSLDFGKD